MKKLIILFLSFVIIILSFSFSFASGPSDTISVYDGGFFVENVNFNSSTGIVSWTANSKSSECTLLYLYCGSVYVKPFTSNFVKGLSVNGTSFSSSPSQLSYVSYDYPHTAFTITTYNSMSVGSTYSINLYDFIQFADDSPFQPRPSVIPYSNANIIIPPGYICVIDRYQLSIDTSVYDGLSDYVNFTTQFQSLSPLVGLWTNGCSYGFTNTYPSGSVSGTEITWNKPASASTNWLGQTHSAGKQIPYNTDSSRYFYFINPLYTYNSNNKGITNGNVIMSFSDDGFNGRYRLISLSSSVSSTGFTNTITSDSSTYYWEGTLNSDEDEYLTQGWSTSEDSYSSTIPPSGGNNSPLVSSSSGTDSLISQLSDILQSGSSRVEQIISSSSSFFTTLSSLWSWLPSDVSSVISSVIIIFFIVGAIKLFL